MCKKIFSLPVKICCYYAIHALLNHMVLLFWAHATWTFLNICVYQSTATVSLNTAKEIVLHINTIYLRTHTQQQQQLEHLTTSITITVSTLGEHPKHQTLILFQFCFKHCKGWKYHHYVYLVERIRNISLHQRYVEHIEIVALFKWCKSIVILF